ncbi:hypothetical protein [Cryptosporangium sp. NPDC051539]|uniref:hypothetical protein n=1 Tax=Cryptosporangium sp. NPDC051539 TaxID=3363962 RepID=UPI003796CB11
MGKVLSGVGLFLAAACLVGLAFVLARQGAEAASYWAALGGFVAAIVGIGISVRATRATADPSRTGPDSFRVQQRGTASQGGMTVQAGRDAHIVTRNPPDEPENDTTTPHR